MHRACVEFRVKLSRDTGTSLPAAVCEELLGGTFGGPAGEQVSLQSKPRALLHEPGGGDRGPNADAHRPEPHDGGVVVLP